jgi:NAD(P)-dependent dehydrogenase (short-subunit alcohol dehydrogenase family)
MRRPEPPFPEQEQQPPGRESDMEPRADHGEESYVGQGRLKDRVALITGADSGIGRAVAIAFAREGADILCSYLNEDDDAAETRRWVEEAGRRCITVPGDIGDREHCRALVDRAVGELGRLDVLVNCHGLYRGGTPVHETPLDAWDAIVDGNARSVFHTCRAAVPHMLRSVQESGDGRIVNVAARAALAGAAGSAIYTASKAAVVRLTESLAAELREKGIGVNCVLPGTIDTPANRASRPGADAGKWVPPEAIADVILFLCSPAARAVHGAAIPVYGLS